MARVRLATLPELGRAVPGGGYHYSSGQAPDDRGAHRRHEFLDQESYVQSGYSAGANFWVRREVIERCGGFNEELEYYGGDDEEFGWRLSAGGARPVYAPEVRLTHPPRTRLRDIAQKAYRLGCSNAVRRRVATGSLSGQPPMYSRPRMYLPPRRVHGLRRVADLDYLPTVLELLQMHVTRYLCVQLVTMAGDFVGERRHRRVARTPPR